MLFPNWILTNILVRKKSSVCLNYLFFLAQRGISSQDQLVVWYLFIRIIWQKNAKNPRCFSLSVSIILSLPVCRTHLSAQTLTAVGKKKKITESEAARKWHFTCGFTRAVKIGFFSETSREARRRSEILFEKKHLEMWRILAKKWIKCTSVQPEREGRGAAVFMTMLSLVISFYQHNTSCGASDFFYW